MILLQDKTPIHSRNTYHTEHASISFEYMNKNQSTRSRCLMQWRLEPARSFQIIWDSASGIASTTRIMFFRGQYFSRQEQHQYKFLFG